MRVLSSIGAALEGIGWSGLSPGERLAAVSGGTLGLGASLALRAAFGGLHLPRRRKRSRKRKGRRR